MVFDVQTLLQIVKGEEESVDKGHRHPGRYLDFGVGLVLVAAATRFVVLTSCVQNVKEGIRFGNLDQILEALAQQPFDQVMVVCRKGKGARYYQYEVLSLHKYFENKEAGLDEKG